MSTLKRTTVTWVNAFRHTRLLAWVMAVGAGVMLVFVGNELIAKMGDGHVVTIEKKMLLTTRAEPVVDEAFWKIVDGKGALGVDANAYGSADGKFRAGVSQYDRMTLQIHNWPVDEFMYLIEGRVEITDSAGTTQIYEAGDAFVMPKGFAGTWRQLSRIRKFNVSYRGSM